MRSAASSLLACLACCATCHGFTLAISGAPPTPRALLSERRTNIAMGMGARGNAPRNPLAAAGAGAARVAAASTASVVQIFSSHPVVEIFSSQRDCADSAAAKRLLGSAGVEFTEHDCSSSEHAQCAPMSKASPTKARPQWRQAGLTSARACLRPPPTSDQPRPIGPRWLATPACFLTQVLPHVGLGRQVPHPHVDLPLLRRAPAGDGWHLVGQARRRHVKLKVTAGPGGCRPVS